MARETVARDGRQRGELTGSRAAGPVRPAARTECAETGRCDDCTRAVGDPVGAAEVVERHESHRRRAAIAAPQLDGDAARRRQVMAPGRRAARDRLVEPRAGVVRGFGDRARLRDLLPAVAGRTIGELAAVAVRVRDRSRQAVAGPGDCAAAALRHVPVGVVDELPAAGGHDGVPAFRVVREAGRGARAQIGSAQDVADRVIGDLEVDGAVPAGFDQPVQGVVSELLDQPLGEVAAAQQVAGCVPVPLLVLDGRAAVAG